MGSKKDWQKTRTIYWKDELNDDFDEVGLERPEVPANYRYLRRTKVLCNIAYYLLGKPIMGLFCLLHGIRVVNKQHLKPLAKTGYFIYANHVATSDVFKFQTLAVGKKRVNIIGYSDALTLKGLGPLLKAFGYLPIPNDIENLKKLKDAVKHLVDHHEAVLIYPEAHIWPYYTKIRNFKNVSFFYPAEFDKPIIPAVTIWRGKPNKKPKQTIVFGQPIYPDKELTPLENRDYLHEQCLLQMKEIAAKYPQVEYIKYIKKED